jgi:hypothetical protein
VFDGTSQEANNTRIQANTLSNALDANNNLLVSGNTAKPVYTLQLTGLKYYVNMPTSNTGTGLGTVEIFWNGSGANATAQYANSATIFHLNMQGEFGLGEQLPAIYNNSVNGNGDIGVYTSGAAANCSYTLIISLRKGNDTYQRGQITEPSSFNYGNWGLRP